MQIKNMLKSIYIIPIFIVLIFYINNYVLFNISHSFSQNPVDKNKNTPSTWISKRENLNISLTLDPKVPIVDKNTKISFDIKKLNSSISSNLEKICGRNNTILYSGGFFYIF